MSKALDLTGQRFGRLVCIKDVGRDKYGNVLWLCLCRCGKKIIVPTKSLISGNTKSCGCTGKEKTKKRNTTHGLCLNKEGKKTRLYGIWMRMKQRCLDVACSDYKNYGGRGIKICDEWLGYKNFHDWAISHGYKKNLTIERCNNAGDYEPDNCEWITAEKQARNKRTNRFITYKGKKKILSEWCKILKMDHSLLRYRLKHWDIERSFNQPIRGRANGH